MINTKVIGKASDYTVQILETVIGYDSKTQQAIIVFDEQCELARVLTDLYRRCLPAANMIHFEKTSGDTIIEKFKDLKPNDLVILIQSSSFRLDKFRIRVSLFNRSIKVIEHPHLSRMIGAEQEYYLESLAYEESYYRGTGRNIQALIDQSEKCVVESQDEALIFSGGLQPAKLNVGDYSEMRNIGGQFPIGEVFTEAKDLERVKGKVRIFAFGDTSYRVNQPQTPITLTVERGRVVETADSTKAFDEVLENIRRDEDGEVWVRELGFGLNRAFTKSRVVTDIGTYERMCGIHLSLGAKHNVYKKEDPRFSPRKAKHHVDVFADVSAVYLDQKNIYQDGRWIV